MVTTAKRRSSGKVSVAQTDVDVIREELSKVTGKPSLALIDETCSRILGKTGHTSIEIALTVADSIEGLYPELAPVVEECRRKLELPERNEYLTVTALSIMYGQRTGVKTSPQKINFYLTAAQLQHWDENLQKWTLEEWGNEYAKPSDDGQTLLWKPAVIGLLTEFRAVA